MDIGRIDEIINEHGGEAHSLIQVLLQIQRENHFLPNEALVRVSGRLGVPMSRVRHVATFYKAFSLVPRGCHEIHVCTGTSCHARGADRVLDAVKEAAGVGPGDTDLEMRFSLETVNCVGCCAQGPLIVIDGKTHGRLTASRTTEVLKQYERQE